MSTNHDELDCRLPVELQQEIFEITASAFPSRIFHLLLVDIWLEPILYRALIFAQDVTYSASITEASPPIIAPKKALQMLSSRPPSFFHKHVRHLCCTGLADHELELILKKCTGVLIISLCHCYSLDPAFAVLPLLAAITPRRLACRLSPLFHPAPIDFTHVLFSRLTHLEMVDSDFRTTDWAPWAGLAALPCLTHLAFIETGSFPMFTGALTACPHLSVLVVVEFAPDQVDEPLSAAFVHDHRFVQLCLAGKLLSWEATAMTGDDHWIKADAIIRDRMARKRRGRSD
ncbi:hypothetical protein C8R43DRAFT_1133067 [Mycena crocata]|nr:hypothetical protein C8R43DRAFT_1133067 [Mycena crocata]